MKFDEKNLELFWRFVYERQEIWYKRFCLLKPGPWTEDPILQTVFFTNVYRELDRGTVYLKEHIISGGLCTPPDVAPEDELFEILVYRTFNNRWTYDYLKKYREYGTWDQKGIAAKLHEYKAQQLRPVFSSAHMTNSRSWGGFKNKIDNYCALLREYWEDRLELYECWENAKNMKQGFELFCELRGLGAFLAYEVVTDLNYSPQLGRWTENHFVNPGHGCKRGIWYLMPEGSKLRKDFAHVGVIERLAEMQETYFFRYRLPFHFYKGKRLTLRNIEHSLCEFGKYMRSYSGGKARRLWSPEE